MEIHRGKTVLRVRPDQTTSVAIVLNATNQFVWTDGDFRATVRDLEDDTVVNVTAGQLIDLGEDPQRLLPQSIGEPGIVTQQIGGASVAAGPLGAHPLAAK